MEAEEAGHQEGIMVEGEAIVVVVVAEVGVEEVEDVAARKSGWLERMYGQRLSLTSTPQPLGRTPYQLVKVSKRALPRLGLQLLAAGHAIRRRM